VTSLAGNHPGDFLVTNDLCNGMTLPAMGTCTVDVQFKPTVLGPRDGLVRITVGGVIIVDGIVRGTADPVNTLTITPPATFAFPDTTATMTSAPHAFTVNNTGTQPTGVLASALAGTDPTEFAIVTATDTCTGQSIPVGGTCSISVVFAPTTAGAKSATVTMSATPGGTATATVTGTAN
ncbi:MAG: choice-of-anchor D domain-containing protein, partial [Myxococcales bacterium]|nr:choice-of-anchor D domain-containing protein [Myxococcales bacterium]